MDSGDIMYEKILNNSEFLDTMTKIGNIRFITDGKWDWEHGLGHVKRVTTHMKQILEYLAVDNKTLELGMIAAILHDVGLISGEKDEHAKHSASLVEKYLERFEMPQLDIDIIVQAISDHSNGDDFQSVIGASLVLADKLDMSKHRVANSSIKDDLNNQIAAINEVKIVINDTDLIIKYLTNGHFDPLILKNWKKAILTPMKISKYLKRNFILLIDEIPYDYNNIINC